MQAPPHNPVCDLNTLLSTLTPVLNGGVYVFCSVPFAAEKSIDIFKLQPLATFREAEGLTMVLEESRAISANLTPLFRAAWITLMVQSDLQAVGLTAAFATALGAAGISCNVMAAAFHDHIFVPLEKAEAAMAVLRNLQKPVQR